MPNPYLDAFVSTIAGQKHGKSPAEGETIHVSETVAAAAAVYETVRNALEYDEEHLLRRNAVRRILKREWGNTEPKKLATDLLHELIWASYLPNNQISVHVIDQLTDILKKYRSLFAVAERASDAHREILWLQDLLSTEIEYHLSPPTADEALASFAYQNLKGRVEWVNTSVQPEDRDLQLFIAVHRAILKSNLPTLRYRIFTLYYPEWTKGTTEEVIDTVALNLRGIIDAVERQIRHPASERLYRLVQKQAIVFHIVSDIVAKDPAAFPAMLEDTKLLQKAVMGAAADRYDRFRTRVRRSIIRAIAFLLLTKSILALAVELPYDVAIAKSHNYFPLMTNILFHPLLLGIIGLTVSIPEEKNTAAIQGEVRSVVGLLDPRPIRFVMRKPKNASTRLAFDVLYTAMFVLTILLIGGGLRAIEFSALSIAFFLFFLSLVTFFGLKIRGTRRDLVIVEGKGNWLSPLFDMFFLPLIRAGRWISMRAPRVNVFLFFFDFIIEAPFKAAIKLIEGWLAFLREKKEEI